MNQLTPKTMGELIRTSPLPVLVEFHAPWCQVCPEQGKVLHALEKKLVGKAVITSVDADRYGRLAEQYKVTSVPTIFIFKDGKQVKRLNGLQGAKEIQEALL